MKSRNETIWQINYNKPNYINNSLSVIKNLKEDSSLSNHNIRSCDKAVNKHPETNKQLAACGMYICSSIASILLKSIFNNYNPDPRYVQETFIRRKQEVTVIRDTFTKLFASKERFYDQEIDINNTRYALDFGANIFDGLSDICKNYLENSFINHNNYYIPYQDNYDLKLIGYNIYGVPIYG